VLHLCNWKQIYHRVFKENTVSTPSGVDLLMQRTNGKRAQISEDAEKERVLASVNSLY